jgi:cytochrome oxidase Cu insertion factor (SCO1/SenC/PrrC family)
MIMEMSCQRMAVKIAIAIVRIVLKRITTSSDFNPATEIGLIKQNVHQSKSCRQQFKSNRLRDACSLLVFGYVSQGGNGLCS